MNEPRYNLKFTPAQNEALERMATELQTTKADVIRKALALLAIAVREQKAGNQLCVASGDQIVKEIVGIL